MTHQSVFRLVHAEARRRAVAAVQAAPGGFVVRVSEPTRSLEQNALLWPLLTEVSKQVEWYGKKLDEESWKDIFTAALKKSRVVPGLDGGFVVLGQRTSQMDKKTFSDLIELIMAFGAERGVVFEDRAEQATNKEVT